MEHKIYTIDAKDRSLGRIASEAAAFLRGKNDVKFTPNIIPDIEVKIINIDKIKITGKKLKQEPYKKYSGYPGGLKIMLLGKVLERKGMPYIIKNTVFGMLPKNKLRKQMIKNLKIQ